MTHRTALSSANQQKQRGFFMRVLLRPFTLGLLVSFCAGAGVVGWFRAGEEAYDVQARRQAYAISIPHMQVAQAPGLSEVFDYRGAGRGVSEYPRPLASAQNVDVGDDYAALPPPEPEAASLNAIAPAAGGNVAASAANEIDKAVIPHGQRTARVAIVIDDIGPNYRESLAAIALPKEITLSLLPYAEQLQTLASRARANGHELLVHLPMEPEDMAHNNPGPQALLLALSPDELRRRVDEALNSFTGHVGVNNHMGSRFTTNMTAMQTVLTELAKRDQIFLDSRTTPQSVGVEVATSLNLKFAGRDVFLDNEIDAEMIALQLKTLERLAKAQGQAIAIGHPYPETIAALKAWLPEAKDRGIEVVPLSQIAHRLGAARVSTGAQ